MANNTKLKEKIAKEKARSIEYYNQCKKCERCGRSIYIGDREKTLCPSCGRYVFKDKKTEFDYRMRGLI